MPTKFFYKCGPILASVMGCLLAMFGPQTAIDAEAGEKEKVILIHGLGRTSKSFQKMEVHLRQHGYDVLNLDYPSRQYDIERLTRQIVRPAITIHWQNRSVKIHFVTHSMGGIIVRYLLQAHPQTYHQDNLGRIVMLAPPNRGSEVVDFLKDKRLIQTIMGPAFGQLSTNPNGFIHSLTDLKAEVGVIAGNQSINWINSLIIPGKDDGKVSVDRSRLATMQDFLIVERTHTFIMNADEVLAAVLQFIQTGRFHDTP